jgi:hypothetical protein
MEETPDLAKRRRSFKRRPGPKNCDHVLCDECAKSNARDVPIPCNVLLITAVLIPVFILLLGISLVAVMLCPRPTRRCTPNGRGPR